MGVGPMSDGLPPAIETFGLRKSFKDKVAVEDLSLRVERGEVFGFLGPNGAGKTTSVKMLLGLITPCSGQGRLLGHPVGSLESLRKVGFLPEHFRFHDWLTAPEFLAFHGRLYGVGRDELRRRIPELLDLVGLLRHLDKKLKQFSKGMLQRVGLAQALLNDPAVVFLDEPTSGLDPLGRRLVRDIIRVLKGKGTTVFLNSHLLSEVEICCDRVSFVKQGRVVQSSSLEALVDGLVRVEIRGAKITPAVVEGLRAWSGSVAWEGELVRLELQDETALPDIHRYLVQQSVDLYAVTPKTVSLEDLFVRIVGTDGGL
jgi:ABC-2 type transport system ATP-binding protein